MPDSATVDEDTWRYELGDAVYTLTAGNDGWYLISTSAHTGRRLRSIRFEDQFDAERAYFRAVAVEAITHQPYAYEATIGGAHLIVAHVGAHWILVKRPELQVVAVFDHEQDARRAWVDQGEHLLRAVADIEHGPSTAAEDMQQRIATGHAGDHPNATPGRQRTRGGPA